MFIIIISVFPAQVKMVEGKKIIKVLIMGLWDFAYQK
jgi:hypothetical protein